ncbi:S8 family serine peptidase, partial [Candidatus Woesearchaeota archaeon]|nr:S8 family serine peptidase [Candidatus Woesearchaeota archaeon]
MKNGVKKGLEICLLLVFVVTSVYFVLYQEGITGMVTGVELAEIEDSIFEELAGEETVSVIIVLEDLEVVAENLEEKKEIINENQEEVLDSLNLEDKERFFGMMTDEKEFEVNHQYSTINAFSGEITEDGLEKLRRNSQVKQVFLNGILTLNLDTSVPQINADDVWDTSIDNLSITGIGETICIVDTGIDTDNDAFSGRILDQYCYCSGSEGCCFNNTPESNSAEDDHGHGTHVSGIAAGNHNTYR